MALTDKLTNIADAIRSKGGTTDQLTLAGMVDAINAIQTGGSGSSDAWNLIEHITAEDAAISYEIPLQPGAKEYGIYWRYTNNETPLRNIKVDGSLAKFGVMFRCSTNEDLFLRVFKGPSNILAMSQNIVYTAQRFSNGGTYIGSGTDFPAMTLETNSACTTSEIWVYWR